MKKILYSCVFVFALVCLSFQLSARHIIGGDVTYECLGVDTIANQGTYLITFIMYRDQFGGGAPFDPDANFGIYRGSGSNWTWVTTVIDAPTQPQVVDFDENPCLIIPPNVGVERAVYQFQVTLPLSTQSYFIAYQRCCRNNTIANIIDPQDAGAAFTIEISPVSQTTCNNSPVFTDFPPIVICAGLPLTFDHSATDAEGDQLVYEFCAPKIGGGPFGSNENPGNMFACNGIRPEPANCPPPYADVLYQLPAFSSTNPMGGNPQVTINPATGLITGTPLINGQFVVGVCVKEYRNGELIGQMNRDFQFNVTTCEPKVTAVIDHDAVLGNKEYVINSCGENTIAFVNQSTDVQFIDVYQWEFDIDGDILMLNSANVEVTFPGIGQYNGTMVLNPGTECSDTATIYVNVYPSIDAEYEFEYDTCVAGPVDFSDLSVSGSGIITNWDWDFEGGSVSDKKNPSHLFETPGTKEVLLTVRDINQCEDTYVAEVNYFPVPPLIVIEPSNFIGCAPAEIFFNNLSTPIDDSYTINWDFGDGETGDAISPTHIFTEEGTYSIDIEIISPIGCRTEKSFPNWILVEPKPVADFDFTPDRPTTFNKVVNFIDQSIGAISWFWNFDNEGTAFEPNPSYVFKDTGVHEIQLIVLHPSGCPDTIVKRIDVIPEVRYFLPNAFTPNNDSVNDLFKAKGVYDGFRDFKMTIWNRWGQRIFETEDPSQGWNGQKDNVGQMSPNGVYVYLVQYIGPRGDRTEFKGFASLIR